GDRADHPAVGAGGVAQVLGHRPAGDGEDVAVDQPGLQQLAEHDRDAPDPVDVGHDEAAAGTHVDDVGDAPADGVEVVHGQLDPGLVGDGQQVEHGVGRAGGGHDHRGRVQEGGP